MGWGGGGGGCKTSFANLIASVWGKKKGTDKYVVCCFIPLWRGCGVERYIGITLFCSFRVGLGGCCLLNITAAAVRWVRKTKSLGPLCTFGLQ